MQGGHADQGQDHYLEQIKMIVLIVLRFSQVGPIQNHPTDHCIGNFGE